MDKPYAMPEQELERFESHAATTPTPKSAVVTLHAGGSTLTLSAVLKADGSAVTTVTTKDAEKKSTRGMTEQHADMAAAKVHLAALAEKAAKLGWQRRAAAGPAAKPDAFSKLPAAPKVA